MATKGDINANVGLNILGGDLDPLINKLKTQVNSLVGDLEKIGNQSGKATKTAGEAAAKAAAEMDGRMKNLQRSLQQIDTLTKNLSTNRNLQNFLGGDVGNQNAAKQIRSVMDFRRSMEEASNTAEKFKVRLADIDKQNLKNAQSGKAVSDQDKRRYDQLNNALKEYQSLSSKISSTGARIGLLSPKSQEEMSGLLTRAKSLETTFSRLASNSKVFNFDNALTTARTLTLELNRQISALERQERQTGILAEKTRQRAKDMLATTPRMEQAQIESAGRKNLSIGTFGNANSQDLDQRLARSAALYARVKAQLTQEVNKGDAADTERLSALMNRYNALRGIIGQTIAARANASKREIKDNEDLSKAINRVEVAYDKAAVAARTRLTRGVSQGIKESEAELKRFQKELDAVGDNGKPAQSKLSQSVKGLLGDGGLALGARVGIYATAASAIYGVINAVKEGAQFVVQFEDKLATLQAISGSTTTQLAQLSEVILDVSKNSRFSAIDIAEASIQLAQAGFSAGDMAKSLQSISDFAAASGTGIKESVELVTGALGAFQLQASETARITDVFAAALNRSKLTSQQIAQAIQYVGTTAYEQNISLEQLVATIGSVAAAGVKAGSTLGTGFRQFLVDLSNPTEKLQEQLKKLGLSLADVDVKTRGLPTVLAALRDAGFGAAQAYEGLEVRAAAFYLTAKNNIDVYDQLMLAESQRGVAALAAERAMDSLTAQWQRFTNVLGQAASDSAPTDMLKELVKLGADIVEKYNEAAKAYRNFKDAQANPDTDTGITAISRDLDTAIISFFKGEEAARAYTDSLRQSATGSADFATRLAEASDQVANQTQKIDGLDKEYARLLLQGGELSDNQTRSAAETLTLTSRFEGLASQLGSTANNYDNLINAMKRYRQQQLQLLGNNLVGEISAGREAASGLSAQYGSARNRVFNNANFKGLPASKQAELRGYLNNPYGNNNSNLGRVSDFAETRLGSGQKELIAALRDAIRAGTATYSQVAVNRQKGQILGNVQYLTTDQGQKYNENLAKVTATVGQLYSQTVGLTPTQRKARLSGARNEVENNIGGIDARLKSSGLTRAERQGLQGQRQEFVSLRQQIAGQGASTKAEDKAAARANAAGARSAEKEKREAERAAAQYNRNEQTASQATLKAADRALTSFLKNDSVGTELSKIPDLFKESDAKLNEWVEARQAVLADAIAKAGLTPSQIEEMTAAANSEIESKQRDTYRAQVDAIDKGLTNFLRQQDKRIQLEYQRALQSSTNSLNRETAISSGLSNPLYRIPQSTQTIQNRRVQLAQENQNNVRAGTYSNGAFSGGADQDQIDARRQELDRVNEAIDNLRAEMSKLDDTTVGGKAAIQARTEEYNKMSIQADTLTQTITDLTQAQEANRLAIEAQNMRPKTLGDGLRDAANAFNIDNNIGIGLTERTIQGMGGALDEIHGSFQEFFTGIITGTQSVGQAFGGMAKAVVAAIAEMAAKAVATQIFGLLLSFIPGVVPGAGSSPVMGGASFNFPSAVPLWNGGKVGNQTPQRLMGGGSVTGGTGTRDSTLIHASKGEFMLRNSSVRSIGEDLLNDMNIRGAAALDGMNKSNIVMPQSQLSSSVYVVLPEEKPQLGPNDILAVVSRDVLRGGATKQLIKQVAAGG